MRYLTLPIVVGEFDGLAQSPSVSAFASAAAGKLFGRLSGR
jgi:hypothetical protein